MNSPLRRVDPSRECADCRGKPREPPKTDHQVAAVAKDLMTPTSALNQECSWWQEIDPRSTCPGALLAPDQAFLSGYFGQPNSTPGGKTLNFSHIFLIFLPAACG